MKKRTLTLEQAKILFPHRLTGEHIPSWALAPLSNGEYYAPQYKDDKEWYENTFFPGEHELAVNGMCFSTNHTFPLGYYLKAPFKVNVKSSVPYEVECGQILHSD